MTGLTACLLLLGLSLGSCDDRGEQLSRQMEELKREVAGLKATSANNAVVMEDFHNKLLLMEDQVDSNRLLVSRMSAPRPVLPVVKLAPVNEQVELETVRPEVTMSDIPGLEFQMLNGSGEVLDESDSFEKAPEAPAEPKAKKPFDSRPIVMYKQAYELLSNKQHAEAILAFEQLLEQYPDHDYSDNALYWMGEAYYDTQNYKKAVACFEKVVALYPDGNKVPDAMLKSSFSYCAMGQTNLANETMGQLVSHYPSTKAAGLAQKKPCRAALTEEQR